MTGRLVAGVYERLLPGATYRNWTDALFLGVVALALATTFVYLDWHGRPDIAGVFMAGAVPWGLLAGFFYGQWRATPPGSLKSSMLRVRSSSSLGVFCVELLLVLLQRFTGI